MNIPLDRTLSCPVPSVHRAQLGEATVVALGQSLCAAFFDRPEAGHARLDAKQDGQPIPRPFITAELPLRSGGVRHVLFLGQGIGTVLSRHLVLSLADVPVAQIDPDWLQPPQGDLTDLIAPLSDAGLRRLLRLMLTTVAALFIGDAEAGLAETALRLAGLCGASPAIPVAQTLIAGRRLVSYSLPDQGRVPDRVDGLAVTGDRLVALRNLQCQAEGALLHVLFPPRVVPSQMLACPDGVLHLAAPNDATRVLTASAWLRGRGKACSDWLAACLGADAMPVPDRTGGQPALHVTVQHLSAGPAGLLYAMTLADPARGVSRIVLEWQGWRCDLVPTHRSDGTAILVGLADTGGISPDGGLCRIRAVEGSGPSRPVSEIPVAAFDSTIPAGFVNAWTCGIDSLMPLAKARAGFRRPAPAVDHQHFGPNQTCGLRIVTAIGTSADLIRARAAMILSEAHPAAVEVVCTVTTGPLASAARHVLAQTAAIYGMSHRLIIVPDVATRGECLRAALEMAQGSPALILGSDVVPQGRGWLDFWLRHLRRREALAPVLLAGDGSVAATQEGADPGRGLPAAFLPPSGRVADRPLAGCLGLGPAGLARLLESGAPHPDSAVWIAAALGGVTRTETRFPFLQAGPAAAPDAFASALADAEFALIERDRP